jgi:hypothetical protein
VAGDDDMSHDVPKVRRLLITKAEAAEQLGVSVRTVERLIAAENYDWSMWKERHGCDVPILRHTWTPWFQ